MKINVERIKPTRVKLTIEVNEEEFKPSLDHAYEHIAEDIQIPGFRKGKVPPAILDKRVGRPAIMAHAINDGLDSIYRQAIEQEKVRPIGQPSADIKKAPDENTFKGELVVEIEVEVRPEIKLPSYKGLKLKVDEVKVAAEEVDAELDALRARFGTLKVVERAAKKGDFTSIDLTAEIDGNVMDTASNISYEIGSGNLLDGIDEALDTLTAGESTTFVSKLVGGELAGKEAQISVTLNSVKERELPKLDDEFAKLYSEFDTVKELKAGIEKQIAESKVFGQGVEARNKVTDALLELVDVPVSDEVVDAEVHNHLESEGRLEDDAHRAEVLADTTKGFKTQMLLDAIAEAEEITVSEQDLIETLAGAAQNYGMDLNEFIKIIDQNGQIPMFVNDTARRKALNIVLEQADVTDSKGKKVDLSSFLKATNLEDDHAGHNHD